MSTVVPEASLRDGAVRPGEQLKRLVIDVLLIEDDEYRDENGPDEISTWDSLATVAIASAIEKTLGIRVPADDMAAFNTIGDIRDFCRAHGLDV